MHLAGVDIEIDAGKGLRPGVALARSPEAQEGWTTTLRRSQT
jgi:hypothetical protein